MERQGRNKKSHKRLFTRTNYNGFGTLFTKYRTYRNISIDDLSISGMFISGEFDIAYSDECDADIYLIRNKITSIIHVTASVARLTDTGAGLKFIYMSMKDYILLQTALIYSFDNPLGVIHEFPEKFPCVTNK